MTNNYTEQIASILSGKIEIQNVSEEVIQILLEEHPYSPYGHLINYLKAKSENRADTNKLLTKLATYSPDRSWLQQVLNTTFKDIEILGSADDAIPSEAKGPNLDKVLFEFDFNYSTDSESQEEEGLTSEGDSSIELSELSEEIVFLSAESTENNKVAAESDSYVSWLKSFQPKKEETINVETVEPIAPPQRSIEQNPVVVEKTTRKDNDLFGGIITETLAELLANQGQTEKAISMYERLSLIFPNKSAFFAAKIDQLKSNITKI